MQEERILTAIAIIVSMAPIAGIVLVYGSIRVVVRNSEIHETLMILTRLELEGKIRKIDSSKKGIVVLQPIKRNAIDLLILETP